MWPWRWMVRLRSMGDEGSATLEIFVRVAGKVVSRF